MKGKKISSSLKSNILILGIGNILMGDEGVGVHVVRYLETLPLPDGVSVLDGGTGSFVLLEPMQLAMHVMIIDATIDGQPTGTVSLLHPKFTSEYPKTLTAHDIGLKDLLDVYHLLGDKPDVTLCAISIEKVDEVNTEMSEILKAKISEFAAIILAEMEKQ